MPVWGVWLDDALYFGTSLGSRKARNLASRPEVVAHLESGDDVVIVEGVAEQVAASEAVGPVEDAYAAKYGLRPNLAESEGSTWFAVRPRVAYAWLETDFPGTTTRYAF
jgi:Pyridoxamine 5'-phosphate oxidase